MNSRTCLILWFSGAPGLTSGLPGSVNVLRGALLLVPQWQCISSFVFYSSLLKHISVFINWRSWFSTNSAKILTPLKKYIYNSKASNFQWACPCGSSWTLLWHTDPRFSFYCSRTSSIRSVVKTVINNTWKHFNYMYMYFKLYSNSLRL